MDAGKRLVVLVDGRRVSRLVHEGPLAEKTADDEKDQFVKQLQESKQATSNVVVRQLLQE
jgi:hypothetical protein